MTRCSHDIGTLVLKNKKPDAPVSLCALPDTLGVVLSSTVKFDREVIDVLWADGVTRKAFAASLRKIH